MSLPDILNDLFKNGAIRAAFEHVFEELARDHDEAAVKLLLDNKDRLAYAEAHAAKTLRGLAFDISKDLK